MTRILGRSRSAIVASRRVRRRQDDDRAARSTDASLRNHRNRPRVLALQKPRLNRCATPACPGGQTDPSRAPLRRTRGGHSAPRGALPFATGTSLSLRLQRGHDWTPIESQTSAPAPIDKRSPMTRSPPLSMRLTDTTSKSPFTRAVRPRPAPLLKPDTARSVRDTDSLLE